MCLRKKNSPKVSKHARICSKMKNMPEENKYALSFSNLPVLRFWALNMLVWQHCCRVQTAVLRRQLWAAVDGRQRHSRPSSQNKQTRFLASVMRPKAYRIAKIKIMSKKNFFWSVRKNSRIYKAEVTGIYRIR